MRDVAPAGTDVITNVNAARNAACSVLVTLCSPLSADVPFIMRGPCQRAGVELQGFFPGAHGLRQAALCRGGKNCLRVYPPLTIAAHLDTGDRDDRAMGASAPCAFTDRTGPRLPQPRR